MANPVQTQLERERIRKANDLIQQKLKKDFKPEPNLDRPVAYYEVGRYYQGSCKGLFTIYEVNPDKKHKTERKRVAEGVGFDYVMPAIEYSLRRKVFK